MKKQFVIGVVLSLLLAIGLVPVTVTAQAPELPETFEAFGLSVNFPEGWGAREGDAGLELANDEAYFEVMDDEADDAVPPGAFAMLILDPATLAGLELLPMSDMMDLMAKTMMESGELELGDPVDVMVGDQPAVRVPIQEPEDDADGFMQGFKLDEETVIIVVAVAHTGELDQFEDVSAAILASISYAPPEVTGEEPAPEFATAFEAQDITVDLPEGWVGDVDDNTVVLANSAETLEAAQSTTVSNIQSGQLAVYVLTFDVEELAGMPLPDVLGLFIGGMIADLQEAQAGEITEDTVGDLSGYSAAFAQSDADMEGEVVGIDIGEGTYVIALVVAYTNEYEDQRSLVWNILATLEVE